MTTFKKELPKKTQVNRGNPTLILVVCVCVCVCVCRVCEAGESHVLVVKCRGATNSYL